MSEFKFKSIDKLAVGWSNSLAPNPGLGVLASPHATCAKKGHSIEIGISCLIGTAVAMNQLCSGWCVASIRSSIRYRPGRRRMGAPVQKHFKGPALGFPSCGPQGHTQQAGGCHQPPVRVRGGLCGSGSGAARRCAGPGCYNL
jgi:hypothetical protein